MLGGQNIKAIHRTCREIEFRSGLESKQAFFLDTLCIPYEFEPKAFWEKTGYLPDFYLTEIDIYVEVKGNDDMVRSTIGCMTEALLGGHMPGGLILLGPVENSETGRRLHPILRAVNGKVVASWCWFRPRGVEMCTPAEEAQVGGPPRLWSLDTKHLRLPNPNLTVVDAYTFALNYRHENPRAQEAGTG